MPPPGAPTAGTPARSSTDRRALRPHEWSQPDPIILPDGQITHFHQEISFSLLLIGHLTRAPAKFGHSHSRVMSPLMHKYLSIATGDHTTGPSDAWGIYLPAGYQWQENSSFPAGSAQPVTVLSGPTTKLQPSPQFLKRSLPLLGY
jgi:hypothetical protein